MITSLHNPAIKNVIKLYKSKERSAQKLFVIEGARELSLAIAGNYKIDRVYVNKEMFAGSKYPDVLNAISEERIIDISPEVFEKIAYRENSDGIIALAIPVLHTLDQLKLSENPFIIVLESVEKPGNLGAILRTADAAGVDAVIVCDPQTDLYNPNVIRSGVGTIFTVPTAICSSKEAIKWLKMNNITSFAAELEASDLYQNANFKGPSAIVMGTEADGLTDIWLKNANKRIKIPMLGIIDSLNVSVSTAVITFEAMRQRNL